MVKHSQHQKTTKEPQESAARMEPQDLQTQLLNTPSFLSHSAKHASPNMPEQQKQPYCQSSFKPRNTLSKKTPVGPRLGHPNNHPKTRTQKQILKKVFEKLGGKQPKRNYVQQLADELGLSQLVTNKWFYDQIRKKKADLKEAQKLKSELCAPEAGAATQKVSGAYGTGKTLNIMNVKTALKIHSRFELEFEAETEALSLDIDALAEFIVDQPSPKGTRWVVALANPSQQESSEQKFAWLAGAKSREKERKDQALSVSSQIADCSVPSKKSEALNQTPSAIFVTTSHPTQEDPLAPAQAESEALIESESEANAEADQGRMTPLQTDYESGKALFDALVEASWDFGRVRLVDSAFNGKQADLLSLFSLGGLPRVLSEAKAREQLKKLALIVPVQQGSLGHFNARMNFRVAAYEDFI